MKHLKTRNQLNEASENLNISDKINEHLPYMPKDGKYLKSHTYLMDDEKNWLKRWLEICDEKFGFESSDKDIMNKIFFKLDIN